MRARRSLSRFRIPMSSSDKFTMRPMQRIWFLKMITKNLRVNWIRSKSRCVNLLRNTLIRKRNSRISRGRMLQWRVKMKRSKVQSQLFRPTSERLTQFRHTTTLSRPFNSLIKSRLVQISRRILLCLIHPLLKRCTRTKRTLEDL